MDKDADRIPRENGNESGPSHVFVKPLGLLQTGFISLLADVPESGPAVSLFFFCLVCSSLSGVARALPHSLPAFLFFLRVGLQQEGHLQASFK